MVEKLFEIICEIYFLRVLKKLEKKREEIESLNLYMITYIYLFSRMTDRPTYQVSNIMEVHCYSKTSRKKFQPCILNKSREYQVLSY